MDKMEKAIICDGIRCRFDGNSAVYWSKLRDEFAGRMHHYYITENNIKFLIADGMIKRDDSIECLHLREKGFATMAEIDTLGYVTKEKSRLEEEKRATMRRCIDRGIQITILIISSIALILSFVVLFKK